MIRRWLTGAVLLTLMAPRWGLAAPSASDSPAAAGPAQVGITNYQFSPTVVEVAVGTQVVWVNHDDSLHSVQSDQFSSKPLDTNDTFRYTFTQPGTYKYLCGFHPHMTGTIVVK
jgi:plastocyanin